MRSIVLFISGATQRAQGQLNSQKEHAFVFAYVRSKIQRVQRDAGKSKKNCKRC